MPLSEAEKWLDHLGSCSPCYADFRRFAEAHAWRRRRTLLAVAAGILLAVAVTGWAMLNKRIENLVTQTAVLDLRDRSPARGAEVNPAEPPLEIARSTSHLKLYLPLGSNEGDYEIEISRPDQKMLFAAKATRGYVPRCRDRFIIGESRSLRFPGQEVWCRVDIVPAATEVMRAPSYCELVKGRLALPSAFASDPHWRHGAQE